MEFPCPSLDNIPLPDGAPQSARLRDARKKATPVCLHPTTTVSPGTSNPKISTDGQLTPFNMDDVPLPSTNYNTADAHTLSIPLPEGNNSSSSAPSKTLVDKLFEDFLSQIKQPEPSTPKVESAASKPAFTNSVEEIKRFLDKEINQLSCKAGFPEVLVASGIVDAKSLLAAERGEVLLREESQAAENASTGVNQRTTPVALPLKIKISDSSVARISSGHVSPPPSCDQSMPDEFIVEVPDVVEDDIQLIDKPVCSENPPDNEIEIIITDSEAKTDPLAPETDHGSNGVAEVVEAKPSKSSSKKHKHKKKKSHKHSKDKNKSTPKLRLHTKKHKNHSKNKHKSSNGTKSPKKTSKTSHSKSKSSKKSKKTKTKTESKSKQLAESSEAESKSNKKSKTRSASPEKQSTEEVIFVKTSALGKIINEDSALKSPKKEERLLLGTTLNFDRKSRSRSRSKSPECSPAKKIMDPICNPEGDPKDASLSPFQAKTLPLKFFSSPPLPALADPTPFMPVTPVTPSVALVTPVTASSVLQAATVSAVSLLAPPLQSQPHVTSPAELPAVSLFVEDVTQSVSVPSVPLSTVPSPTQPDISMQPALVASPPALVPSPLVVSKLSPPLSLSSPLNRPSVLSPAKSLPQVEEPIGPPVSLFKASSGISPSLGIFNKSQDKETLPNCSQTSLQTEALVPISSVSTDLVKDSCLSSSATDSKEQTIKVGFTLNPLNKNTRMSSPIDLSEPADKVTSSLKPLTKNSTAGQSGLLGLAAYFKSKAQSPSPESTKDKKLAKSSGKKTKSFSDSSDEPSSPKKRSRSASRKSSHSRSLSRSGVGKHSSTEKRKKQRPRPKKSRSSSRSRSRSRSRSKSRRRPAVKAAAKKRSRSRSRSRSNERARQSSSFRSNKRRCSRSPSRSRNKTHGRSRSRSRSRGRNRVTGHRGASRSRSPSKKRATHRRTRSRSRSFSRGRYRHHITARSNKSKSRSRSRSRTDVRARDKRSRSRSSGRPRDYRPGNNKYRRFSRRRSRSRSRSSSASSSHSRRRRSRSKSNSLGIDKVMLHDFAVKKLLESGQAPKEEVASLRAGGKTVQGLIDYCKRISQREKESDEDDSTRAPKKSDDEDEGPSIHHPFKIREAQPTIVLNIKPCPMSTNFSKHLALCNEAYSASPVVVEEKKETMAELGGGEGDDTWNL